MDRHAVGDEVLGPGAAEGLQVEQLQLERRAIVAGQEHAEHQGLARPEDAVLTATGVVQVEGQLLVHPELLGVPFDHRQEADVVVRVGQQDPVAGHRSQVEALLVGRPGGREVVHPVREATLGGERGDPDVSVTARRAGKQVGQDRAGLANPPSRQIPAPDRPNEPKAKIRLAVGDRQVDRGAEVPIVAIEAPHGRLPARPEHPLPGRLRHPDADGPETRLDERALPGVREPLNLRIREGADGG